MSLAGNAAWLAAGSYNCRWLPWQIPLGFMRHDDDTAQQTHRHSGRPPVAFEVSFNSAGDAKDDHNITQLPIEDSEGQQLYLMRGLDQLETQRKTKTPFNCNSEIGGLVDVY